jgi:response regulator RpfG family c-di-GMP phosphodiesterase
MRFQKNRILRLCSGLFKGIAAFIIGSIGAHLIVMFLDYYFLTQPVYLNLRENFVSSIFSGAMLPMMGAYGLFSIFTYSMWERLKKAMVLARAEEIKSQKVEAVLKSMQHITGMLGEHIAMHNAEIMNWVESRKMNGNQVSEKIEKPCHKIANALHSLSEISFIFPYSKNRPCDVSEFEEILQKKLSSRTTSKHLPHR